MKYAIFPLNIFLLPGEQTALHIFEERYKQLLNDVEEMNIPFGIYFQNKENTIKYGSMVELVSVERRYRGGESDIMVEAKYLFRLDTFYGTLGNKEYSGGNISKLEDKGNVELEASVFDELASIVKIRHPDKIAEVQRYLWDVALYLNLDSMDKFNLAKMNNEKNQQEFLRSHIKLNKAILEQERNSRINMFPNYN